MIDAAPGWYAADGRPVEVTDQLLAGDRHILSYDIPAREPAGHASKP